VCKPHLDLLALDLAEIRVNVTESRFVACLNRLLQQNLPLAVMREDGLYVGACSCPRSHAFVLRDFIVSICSNTV
jgi:hypothetical protein